MFKLNEILTNPIIHKEHDENILKPYEYIHNIPGKNIRVKFAEAFNYWLEIPEEKMKEIAEMGQVLHQASLLLDDIEDNSVLRRGVPAAHFIFGIDYSINTANYVAFEILQRANKLGHPEAGGVTLHQILELLRGQGMDIYFRDNFVCPSEQEYIEMVKRKTGGIFVLIVELMQLFSKKPIKCTKLASLIGLYFQIRDDYMNLTSEEYTQLKTYCEDITEGKFSFPVIHAITSQPDDKQIINMLRLRPTEFVIKKYFVDLLHKFGSLEYTEHKLNEIKLQIIGEMNKMGKNPIMDKVLASLKV